MGQDDIQTVLTQLFRSPLVQETILGASEAEFARTPSGLQLIILRRHFAVPCSDRIGPPVQCNCRRLGSHRKSIPALNNYLVGYKCDHVDLSMFEGRMSAISHGEITSVHHWTDSLFTHHNS
jgi:hypothetical protein